MINNNCFSAITSKISIVYHEFLQIVTHIQLHLLFVYQAYEDDSSKWFAMLYNIIGIQRHACKYHKMYFSCSVVRYASVCKLLLLVRPCAASMKPLICLSFFIITRNKMHSYGYILVSYLIPFEVY
jgi:hypothetical protein